MLRRVGFVSLHTSPTATPGAGDAGGMNVVELNAAQALARRGIAVDLITRWSAPASELITELAPGLRLIQLPVGPPAVVAKSAQEAFIEPFGRALDELDSYQVLHSHHWFSGMAALPVAKAWGVPHLQSFHSVAAPPESGLHLGEPAESPGRLAGERAAAATSDLIIAVSDAERDTITHRLGADPDRIRVVRPAVDSSFFAPLATGERPWRPVGVAIETPLLVFAARLQPLKGADLAVEAFALLPPEVPAHLLIAGAGSVDFADYESDLHRMVSAHRLDGRVSYLGSVPRSTLAQILRSATLVLVPSHSETFGLIALEAEASGTPVIAAHAGGLVEAVPDGQGGIVLDSRDPAIWAETIRTLLDAPAEMARLARGARAFAASRSWDDVAADLAACYQRALFSHGN